MLAKEIDEYLTASNRRNQCSKLCSAALESCLTEVDGGLGQIYVSVCVCIFCFVCERVTMVAGQLQRCLRVCACACVQVCL